MNRTKKARRTEDDLPRCYRCGQPVNPKTAKMIELNTNGELLRAGDTSMGGFYIGASCLRAQEAK